MEEALEIIHEIIKLEPDDLYYRTDLLQTLDAFGKYDEAELLKEADGNFKN